MCCPITSWQVWQPMQQSCTLLIFLLLNSAAMGLSTGAEGIEPAGLNHRILGDLCVAEHAQKGTPANAYAHTHTQRLTHKHMIPPGAVQVEARPVMELPAVLLPKYTIALPFGPWNSSLTPTWRLASAGGHDLACAGEWRRPVVQPSTLPLDQFCCTPISGPGSITHRSEQSIPHDSNRADRPVFPVQASGVDRWEAWKSREMMPLPQAFHQRCPKEMCPLCTPMYPL